MNTLKTFTPLITAISGAMLLLALVTPSASARSISRPRPASPVPPIAHIGPFVLGETTIEQLTKRFGRGKTMIGGHSNGARAWSMPKYGCSVYADGFYYNERGEVVDTFDVQAARDEYGGYKQPIRLHDVAFLDRISLGMKRWSVVAILRSLGLPTAEAGSVIKLSATGSKRYSRYDRFVDWTAELDFDRGRLDRIPLFCDRMSSAGGHLPALPAAFLHDSEGLMKIAIIDYGMGNLRSVEKALHYVGAPGAFVTSDAAEIESADKAVLPGDGAFDSTMDSLRASGIDTVVAEFAATGKPLLGICIGMQVMLSSSQEGRSGVKGLGLVPGSVLRFHSDNHRLRVPQIGWNRLRAENSSKLLHGFGSDEPYVYCLHSYYCAPDNADAVAGTVEYGVRYCAAIERGNLYATQFHPEKSGDAGLHILRNFVTLT